MDESPAKDQQLTEKSELTYEETPIIDPVSGQITQQPSHVQEPAVPTPEPPVIHDSPQNSDPIDVVPEASQIFGSVPVQAPESDESTHSGDSVLPKPAKKNHIGTIIFVVMLFGLGVWLSMQLRSFFAPASSQEVPIPTAALLPITTSSPSTQATSSATVDSSWVTYQVISGVTRKPVAGVSFKLPAGVQAPVCDGGSCPSQGTNLPNGTRFTIAARGKGQLLPDFRGAILTDATGKEFTMKQTTVNNIYGYEYVGNFSGRTGGGYSFTAMRGILVPVNENLSIEFNHFATVGIVSDFVKDETIFNTIVGTFMTNFPTPSAAIITPTTAAFLPSITPATSSGNKGF